MTARKGFYANVRALRSEVDILTDRPYLAVSPQHGSDTSNDGTSFTSPYATVAKALSVMVDNQTIFVTGDIREQVTAPLGVYGGKIIGVAGGRPRYTTADGVVLDGNSAAWREPASSTAVPLLLLREQGWEVHNIQMQPGAGRGAIKLHRDESATYPDASHAIIKGVTFAGSAQAGYGIHDVGQNSNIRVEDCEFRTLEYAHHALTGGAWGGAAPNRQLWLNNKFTGNKIDLKSNFFGSTFKGNRFHTPYDVTTHPTTLDLAPTASSGLAADVNYVIENYFADAAAAVLISKGYRAATGDVWRNYVADTAAMIVTVPGA